jgi:hypothetical protein
MNHLKIDFVSSQLQSFDKHLYPRLSAGHEPVGTKRFLQNQQIFSISGAICPPFSNILITFPLAFVQRMFSFFQSQE